MTDFKAKMHQIRFRLGRRPDPAGRELTVLPDPLAGFGGRLTHVCHTSVGSMGLKGGRPRGLCVTLNVFKISSLLPGNKFEKTKRLCLITTCLASVKYMC